MNEEKENKDAEIEENAENTSQAVHENEGDA